MTNVKQIQQLLCGFQSASSDRFSGDSYEGPPVPISNTVVKLVNAESTWLETAREDRKSLIPFFKTDGVIGLKEKNGAATKKHLTQSPIHGILIKSLRHRGIAQLVE